MEDCRDVVGPHVPIDELLGRLLHLRRAHGGYVLIVEEDDVETAGKRPAIRLRVAGHRPSVDHERVVLLDWNFDVGERVDLLRLAVFEYLEIVPREARDEVALLVGDDHVDVDVVHLDLKRDRWRPLRGLCLDGRRRLKSGRTNGERNELSLHKYGPIEW